VHDVREVPILLQKYFGGARRGRVQNEIPAEARPANWDSRKTAGRRVRFFQSHHLSVIGATFATKSASKRLMHRSKCHLFNHLIGRRKQRWRHREAERLGCLEVDHEFVRRLSGVPVRLIGTSGVAPLPNPH
jgi:hypothetical protein